MSGSGVVALACVSGGAASARHTGAMVVSARDRFVMQVIARDLAALESSTEVLASELARVIAPANRDRRAAGIADLVIGQEPPEVAFYRHARACGFR